MIHLVRRSTFLAITFAILLIASCKENSIVAPPPPPSMTGRWDITLTGTMGSLTGLADITENNGALTASLTLVNLPALPMAGSVSQSYQVTLGGNDSGGRYLITGTTNSQKTALNGKMDLWDTSTAPETYSGYLNLSATKR